MKLTFLGAGSTIFARNVIGDCMCSEVLRDSVFALYDIDGKRIEESRTGGRRHRRHGLSLAAAKSRRNGKTQYSEVAAIGTLPDDAPTFRLSAHGQAVEKAQYKKDRNHQQAIEQHLPVDIPKASQLIDIDKERSRNGYMEHQPVSLLEKLPRQEATALEPIPKQYHQHHRRDGIECRQNDGEKHVKSPAP